MLNKPKLQLFIHPKTLNCWMGKAELKINAENEQADQ